ncbi:unnamed protein product [Ixodes pacificus]
MFLDARFFLQIFFLIFFFQGMHFSRMSPSLLVSICCIKMFRNVFCIKFLFCFTPSFVPYVANKTTVKSFLKGAKKMAILGSHGRGSSISKCTWVEGWKLALV